MKIADLETHLEHPKVIYAYNEVKNSLMHVMKDMSLIFCCLCVRIFYIRLPIKNASVINIKPQCLM